MNGNRTVLDKRIYLLVFAGLVIAGLCAFRVAHPPASRSTARPASASVPAPSFELYDQNSPSHLVRLDAYLGRHRILLVFFDGKAGADHSAVLERLKNEADRWHAADLIVLAVSTALPQENRKVIAAHGFYPFPLLSDPDRHVHQAWGRVDRSTHRGLEGVFLIDRKGWVAANPGTRVPQPLSNWMETLDRLERVE